MANGSSSLNFLNEQIWWLQFSIYVLSQNVSDHSHIWVFDIFQIFSCRKCPVSHQEVKIYYYEKSHFFCKMLISRTYILSFEIWEKMVADNSKMASTITVFKNLQIFMQQIDCLNGKINFPLKTDEYILSKWAELVAGGDMQNIWKLKNNPRYFCVNTTKYYKWNKDWTRLRK